MEELLKLLLSNQYLKTAESMLSDQTWEHLKKNELIFGYSHIMALLNPFFQKQGILLQQLFCPSENQLRVVVSYRNTAKADIVFTFDKFVLSSHEAFFAFQMEIKDLSSLPDAGFIDKLKIGGADIFTKLFPQYITGKLLENISAAPGIKATVKDEFITLDFQQSLKTTPLNKAFLGITILDFVQISSLFPAKEGLSIRFAFTFPQWLKTLCAMFFSAQVDKFLNRPLKNRRKRTLSPLIKSFASKKRLCLD